MKKLASFKYALVASFVTHTLAFAVGTRPGSPAHDDGAVLNQPLQAAVLAVPAPVEVADAPADQGNAHGNVIPVVALDVAPAAQNQGHQDALAHASDDEEDAEAPHAAAHESSDEEENPHASDHGSDDEEEENPQGAPVKRKNSESKNAPAKRVKLAEPVAQGGQAPQLLVAATNTGAAPAPQTPVITPAAPQPTVSLFAQAAAAFNPRNVARGFVAGLTILTGKNPRK